MIKRHKGNDEELYRVCKLACGSVSLGLAYSNLNIDFLFVVRE
jgi:hypothetical protein